MDRQQTGIVSFFTRTRTTEVKEKAWRVGEVSGRRHIPRNANIEALRIVSICMVTLLHALGKGGLLVDIAQTPSVNGWIAWGLESLAIPAVNVFMLISGYFLAFSSFKPFRLVELVFQIMFYAIGAHFVCQWLGIVPAHDETLNEIAQWLCPIHTNVYWFMNVYLCIYLLLPLFASEIRSVGQKQYVLIILLLLLLDCIPKSVAPIRLFDARGYSFLWCFTMFLIGGYLRRFGFGKLNSPLKGLLLYIVASVFILGETTALQYFNFHKGLFTQIRRISMDYNHVFVLMSSLGLFGAVIHLRPMRSRLAKIVCSISPMVLGVYLVQENLTLRHEWQQWFGLPWALNDSVCKMVLKLLLATAGVFVAGIAIDYCRIGLFGLVKRIAFSQHGSN